MLRSALKFGTAIKQRGVICSFPFRLFSTNSTNLDYKITDFGYFTSKLELISGISSRNESIKETQDLIHDYLKLGDDELFIGFMKMLVLKTDQENYFLANSTIMDVINQNGDIGDYARQMMEKNLSSFDSQAIQQTRVSIKQAIDIFHEISQLSGIGSRQAKNELIINFINKLNDPVSVQFFIRILSKGLRIGVNTKSIVKALENINTNSNGIYNKTIAQLEKEVFGFKTGLIDSSPIGVPIVPMAAKALSSIPEVEKFFSKFESKKISIELKYDGERTQIHYSREEQSLNLFSRNLEQQNQKNPALVQSLLKFFNEETDINSCILDGELIITDETGKIMTFQDQQNRPRKLTEGQEDDSNSKVFLFDLMMIDNQDMTKCNQSIRLDTLAKRLPKSGPIEFVQKEILDLSNESALKQVEEVLTNYINNSQEGAMVKSLSSETYYDSIGRTFWAKLKKQVLQGGIADSFDVLPIAAYFGKGKRSGKYGAYLLACYDAEKDNYQALCKIGTGFSDIFMDESTERLKPKVVTEKPKSYFVHRTLKPDVWFSDPEEVWEISADSLTQSSIYSIGLNPTNLKGISLRFPRFHRIRTDKQVNQSTSTSQMIEFFSQQEQKRENSSKLTEETE